MSTPLAGAYIALPSIVLSAFASELYLKCLLCLEGHDDLPQIHSLWRLFKRLRRGTKEALCASWQQELPKLAAAFEVFRRQHNFEPPDDLPSALRLGADAFQQLRYSYEGTPKTSFFLGGLPRMLKQVVLEKKPDWRHLGPAVGGPIEVEKRD